MVEMGHSGVSVTFTCSISHLLCVSFKPLTPGPCCSRSWRYLPQQSHSSEQCVRFRFRVDAHRIPFAEFFWATLTPMISCVKSMSLKTCCAQTVTVILKNRCYHFWRQHQKRNSPSRLTARWLTPSDTSPQASASYELRPRHQFVLGTTCPSAW